MIIESSENIDWSNIKNIIFDWGGVVVNIDYNITVERFEQIGIPDFHNLFSQEYQSNLFKDFERGKVSPDLIRDELKKHANADITNEQIDAAWNAMLLDTPIERINLINSLKNKFRLFLLSNTNRIHTTSYLERFKAEQNIDFFDLFDKIYLSCEVGMRKPDEEIYKYVCDNAMISPNETLFIDDTEHNLITASNFGIQCYLHGGTDDITKYMAGLVENLN